MKNKSLNLIVGLLMMIALAGALLLVKQNQNTERGAYFAGTKLLMQPGAVTGAVGGDILVQLYAETEKIISVDVVGSSVTACNGVARPSEQCNAESGNMLRVRPECISNSWDFDDQLCNTVGRKDVCGGQNYCCPSVGGKWTTDMTACGAEEGVYAKISSLDTVVCFGSNLKITDPATQVTFNDEALKIKLDASVVTVDGKSCLRLIAISDTAAKPEDLKGGMVKLATIKFKGESAGTGKVEFLTDKTKVGGYNPAKDATDMALKVGTVTNATYTVGTGSTGCNLTVNPPRLCQSGYYCKSISDLNGADGVCVEGCGTDADCSNGQVCTNHVCTTVTTDAPVLNYMVSFGNVNAGDAKCVVNWPLQVIVLSSGVSKSYSVTPAKIGESNGKVAFGGSLPLTNFNHLDKVAAFIKGPKHLQMKYAIQNQSESYNKAGGELTLTKDKNTSPIYNFTAYPIVPGDVKGPESDNPDGWIDGVDFAFVKARSLTHETVGEGGYLKADLDGNCQVNSNDVTVLKISLQTKQGQLY